MTTWYAATTAAAALTDEQLAEATERLPGFATIHHDAAQGLLEAGFQIDAPDIESAARSACSWATEVFRRQPASVTVAGQPPASSLRRQLAGKLVGATEGAAILGVSRPQFHKLAATPPAGWPTPVDRVGGADIYLREDLVQFAAQRSPAHTGRPAAAAVQEAARLIAAALSALEAAGFVPDQDIAVGKGAGQHVLVNLLSPHRGAACAQQAADALTAAGLDLYPHAGRQNGRDLVEALADGELLRLIPVANNV